MSDEKIFQLCRQYGTTALEARRKFAGLLPEVYRRHLYKRKGFKDIFEFARILGGFSEEQVRRVLNLEKKFEDKPLLKSLLENGEVSVHKLARIASVATVENQEAWADKAQILSKSALETLVKDERMAQQAEHTREKDGLQEGLFKDASAVPGHRFNTENKNNVAEPLNLLKLKLTPENLEKLLELQEKGININALIEATLQNRDQEIRQEKEGLAAQIYTKKNVEQGKSSRYVPLKIKRIIEQEHGNKCSMPSCSKPAQNLHHTQRFALAKNHDPHYLAPLCKEHHQIAHTIDQKFHTLRQAKVMATNSTSYKSTPATAK